MILACRGCGGHLVPTRRVEFIKRNDAKTRAELKTDAASFSGSTSRPPACPRCRAEMRKESADFRTIDIEIDVCRGCALAWFDGGELALLQLAYEATKRHVDNQEMKQRIADIEASPERKARFEESLSQLRPGTAAHIETVFDAIGESLADAFDNRGSNMTDW